MSHNDEEERVTLLNPSDDEVLIDENKLALQKEDNNKSRIEVTNVTNVNVPPAITKQQVSASVLNVFCISIFLIGISTV